MSKRGPGFGHPVHVQVHLNFMFGGRGTTKNQDQTLVGAESKSHPSALASTPPLIYAAVRFSCSVVFPFLLPRPIPKTSRYNLNAL